MLCVDLAGFLQLDTFTVTNFFFGGILKHRCDMHVLKIGDLTYKSGITWYFGDF